jgi:hypothetical protein
MGIDGIGKRGGPPPLDGPQPGTRGGAVSETGSGSGKEFRVERTQTPDSAAPVSAATDLERLERGELSRDEYLQGRVEQATTHLQGTLPPERLDELKQQLRAQLEVDPVLRTLLQRATGSAEAQSSEGT